MNKYINEVYFDKVRWILSHLKDLDISSNEIIVILSIIILKEKNQTVNIKTISNSSNLTHKQVDDAITLLASKNYLQIKVCAGDVTFNVDNIFDMKKEVNDAVVDLFEIFEEEFSRMLTQAELVRLNEWIKEYSRDDIINALRNASIMKKLHFDYINAILRNDSNE